MGLTFLTPRIFLALFFLSFICFLDFSTLVASPFCQNAQRIRGGAPDDDPRWSIGIVWPIGT